ncbi:hypothetical protein EV189_2595 [Motilibacter rhizosphaerae]|uniref:Uncharacterized protein n=1 Tax=Motilibacter rhizosphaerae TaxID=598652 RepID=A0A4Q7NPH3_9ACTN|nr:PPA1309 family protein [Motilibacter rhizosphaerae]RZS87171.1 hypothetical protein EV189_2595 [Motilibacter rhizosphaerae]
MTSTPPSPLEEVVVEVERHVARGGWDAPPRLFALVPTSDLLAAEPGLAASLADAGAYTPVEQEDLPSADSLEDLLGGIAWPDAVVGAALVVERLVLPADAEGAIPDDEQDALRWVAEHPRRQEVRLAVGVLRDGERASVVRLRDHDDDLEVLVGQDLVPGLREALAATFG